MADELNTQTVPGVPTENMANDDLASVGRAELEQLRSDSEKLARLNGYAKEADPDWDAETYMEQLETAVNQSLNQPSDPSPVTPPTPAPIVPDAPPAFAGLSAAQLAELDAASKRSTQAFLEVQNLQWQNAQGLLPEGERSVAERKELDALILSSPAAVRQLAADRLHGGNVYSAANALFSGTSEGLRRARKAAEANATAKSAAAASATIPTGGTTALPSTATAMEKYAAAQKAAADAIAKDDPPYEPPI